MANECLNVFEVSGTPEDVMAFVEEAKGADGGALDFDSLLKGPAAPRASEVANLRPVEAPETFDEGDLKVASYTVASKGSGPEVLVARVAEARPSLTIRLLSVEPNARVARAVVLRGRESWISEAEDLDWDAMDEDENAEGRILDVLHADSESVVDDMRRAVVRAP